MAPACSAQSSLITNYFQGININLHSVVLYKCVTSSAGVKSYCEVLDTGPRAQTAWQRSLKLRSSTIAQELYLAASACLSHTLHSQRQP